MSKFFKALEQAERDRALNEQGLPEERGRPVGYEAPDVAAAAPAPPDVTTVVSAAAAPPAEAADTSVVSTPAAPPARAADTSPVNTEVEAPAPARPPLSAPIGPSMPADDIGEVEPHLVSLHAPTSFAAEQYRTLRHVIEADASLQVLGITSPSRGDGKTTTAANLAGVLAQSPGARVLIIDADLRAPQLNQYLGISPSQQRTGLVNLLSDSRLPFEAAVIQRRPYNIDMMPAGNPPANPYEVLKSPRLEWVLREARNRYHFVLVDTPPAVPLPDVRQIATWVDGFIILVSANRTPRGMLQETLETLSTAKLVGIVFNQDDGGEPGYASYYATPNGGGSRRLSRALQQVGRPLIGSLKMVRRKT